MEWLCCLGGGGGGGGGEARSAAAAPAAAAPAQPKARDISPARKPLLSDAPGMSEGEAREQLQRLLLGHESSRFSPLRQLSTSSAPPPRSKVPSLLTNERAAACLCVLAYSEVSTTQSYAAAVLQEAAESRGDALPPVVQQDVVRASVALLQSLDTRALTLTLSALNQLARHDENRRLLIRGGVLQAAVPQARSNDAQVRAGAISLLRLLAMAEESRGVLGKAESLEALLAAVRTPELCQGALEALGELALNEGNHAGMLALGLSELCAKAAAPDAQLAQHALHVLELLARLPSSRTRLASGLGLIALLIRYTHSSDVLLQNSALAVLSYLVQGTAEAETILRDDPSLPSLLITTASIPLSADLDRTRRRLRASAAHAAIALAMHPSTYPALPKGALLSLFRLFAARPPVPVEDAAIAAKALLHHLLAERTHPVLPPPLLVRSDALLVTSVLLSSKEALVRHYSAAIVHLALGDSTLRSDEVAVAPWISFALEILLHAPDEAARIEAAGALELLANERAHHADLLRHHHCLAAALSASDALTASALRTLLRLAQTEQGAPVLGSDADLLSSLLSAARRSDVDVKRHALQLIVDLCRLDAATALRVAQAGAVEPLLATGLDMDDTLASALLEALLSRADEGAVAALTALRNVAAACAPALLTRLTRPPALTALGSALASSSADVQWHAARAVARLAERGQADAIASAAPLAQALSLALASPETRVAAAAAEASAELCKVSNASAAALLASGALSPLALLITGELPDAQRSALAALSSILRLSAATEPARAAGIADALRTAATHAAEPMRSHAAELLERLSKAVQ